MHNIEKIKKWEAGLDPDEEQTLSTEDYLEEIKKGKIDPIAQILEKQAKARAKALTMKPEERDKVAKQILKTLEGKTPEMEAQEKKEMTAGLLKKVKSQLGNAQRKKVQ